MSTESTEETMKIRYTDTRSAYDAWSSIYDTDGNFLQALDTIEMKSLAPHMLSLIQAEKPWRIVDLGCGTGRNTLGLLTLPEVEVTALDLSSGMLEIARKRLNEESRRLARTSKVNFEVFDMLTANVVPEVAMNADAIVSTLVVEHIPLTNFFATAAKILKPGGILLVTNMHSEMGNISQAGFIDPETGVKIRPKSYAHTVEDTIAEARVYGFEVVVDFAEKAVDAELARKLGERAGKWVGVTVWFGGIFRRLM